MKKLFALVLTLALLTSAALATQLSPATEGEEVSDFEVTLSDGSTFRLSDQRGKAVLVNLWATWCPPCVAEMPDLQKLSEDYADSLVVLGVNISDSAEDAAAFMEENGYTFPVVMDTTGEIFYYYGITAFPTTFMIGADGNVFGYVPGALTGDIMESIVQQTMDGVAEQETE